MRILPFPHRNTISFLGMGCRQEYLIWREKDGFFTALSQEGILTTWVVASGRMLYRTKIENPKEFEKYVIY